MYDVKLAVFQGPLDLLLHLVEREELDITTVSLVQVTDQYLAQLRSGEAINYAALADFIAVGARLLYLKSRALLPRPALQEEERQDEGRELVEMLTEYRQYKEVADYLQEIERRGRRAYLRKAAPGQIPLPLGLGDITLDALAALFQEALERAPKPPPPQEVARETITVREKIRLLLEALRRQGRVDFRQLISACRTRVEVIVQFLAVLELIKRKQVRAQQAEVFGDITLLPARGALPVRAGRRRPRPATPEVGLPLDTPTPTNGNPRRPA